MYLLIGILMIAAIVSLIMLLINRSKENAITFAVAVTLWLTAAAMAGNSQ